MLSVTIIARDAADTIERCITSLKDISSDIVVVVDDRTTDNTREVASKAGARVFARQFDDFAGQKNFAADQARGEWILAMDDDEIVSQKLAQEISVTLSHSDCVAYGIPRLNIMFGKPMHHTNWEPKADTHVWLWRKDAGKWVGIVHEELVVQGKVGKLQGEKIHYSYQSVDEFVAKMIVITSGEKKFVNPFYDFFRRYIWHLGILDGWHGLFLSYLMFIYYTIVWVKLWEKTQKLS